MDIRETCFSELKYIDNYIFVGVYTNLEVMYKHENGHKPHYNKKRFLCMVMYANTFFTIGHPHVCLLRKAHTIERRASQHNNLVTLDKCDEDDVVVVHLRCRQQHLLYAHVGTPMYLNQNAQCSHKKENNRTSWHNTSCPWGWRQINPKEPLYRDRTPN